MVRPTLGIAHGKDGLIINLALTGCVATKEHTPYLPVNHDEIVDDVAECMELGVQMVHLHVRDDDGKHSADPERYGRMIESIRALPGGSDLIICASTSGRHDPGFESRARVLELDGKMKPDMASLTLSSLNFSNSASINEPETIMRLAEKMLEKDIKPELEIFDLGMINVAHNLIEEGLIKPPIYTNILLGNIAGAQPSLNEVSALMNSVPADWAVSLAGIGRAQLIANILGVMYADGVRVGLEDNVWLNKEQRQHAKNADLVKRICRIAGECSKKLLPKIALKQKLLEQ